MRQLVVCFWLCGHYSNKGEGNIDFLKSSWTMMVSKIAGHNGQISIQCQQTSLVHKWLLMAANAIYLADTSAWTQLAATLRNTSDGTSHLATGISIGKVPDKTYTAAGGMVTWVFMGRRYSIN